MKNQPDYRAAVKPVGMGAVDRSVPSAPTIGGSAKSEVGTFAYTNGEPAVVGGSAAGRGAPASAKSDLFVFRHDISAARDLVSVREVVLDKPSARREPAAASRSGPDCVVDGVVTVTLSDNTRVSFSAVAGDENRRP
ncbi:MAG TPA: hypothetical protein PLD10_08065 [Rhodopila sp.]|nr:hypothetical protein [Rhodopila sp.]